MPTNKEEDKALAKSARASIARTSLDISELMVTCTGGFVELHGKVRAPRGSSGQMNVRKEFQNLITLIRSVRGVKDCYGDRVAIFE